VVDESSSGVGVFVEGVSESVWTFGKPEAEVVNGYAPKSVTQLRNDASTPGVLLCAGSRWSV
jgi:hypothetical protein